MKTKKIIALILTAVMVLSFAACGAKTEPETTTEPSTTPVAVNAQVNIASLKGPTGIGTAKLMSDNDAGTALNKYTFTLSSDPTEISAGIISGSLDIAACPLNLASVLYNKTKGNVQMLAVNTLGVLYILTTNPDINSVADLAGKTVIASGKGATPEYVLDYLLEKNGVKDSVTVEYKSEHSEVATLAASGGAEIVLLPEPNVTAALTQNQNLRIAVNMTTEFEKASGVSLAMGCIIVRKDFAEANKEAVNAFVSEYKKSVEYVSSNLDETSALCETYGIIPKAAVAKKAIPNCNITFISGADMKKTATENLTVLFNANAASVGGAMPDEDFWYGV